MDREKEEKKDRRFKSAEQTALRTGVESYIQPQRTGCSLALVHYIYTTSSLCSKKTVPIRLVWLMYMYGSRLSQRRHISRGFNLGCCDREKSSMFDPIYIYNPNAACMSH